MEALIRILNSICTAAIVVFFALMVVMVGGHIVGLFTLNGALAAASTATIRPIAGYVGAVAAITAFVLSYLRKLKR